jgi:hypothetical protein
MQDLSIRKARDLSPVAKEVFEAILGRHLLDDDSIPAPGRPGLVVRARDSPTRYDLAEDNRQDLLLTPSVS